MPGSGQNCLPSTGSLPTGPRLITTDQPLPLGAEVDRAAQATDQTVAECRNWLSFHRFGANYLLRLSRRSPSLCTAFGWNHRPLIYQEGHPSVGIYVLKWGTVEISRCSSIGKFLIRYRNAGDLFGYASLMANPENSRHQTQAIALTASEIWFLPQAQFQQLMQQYAEIERLFNALLAQDLNAFSARIAQEQRRIQGLQAYIQAVPSGATILGHSKASQKLAEQVEHAAATLQPVVLQGQPGTGKTFLAGLIHARSALADQPFAELDCARLPRSEAGSLNTDLLFGRIGGQPGILELLERGTLLLNNVQMLSEGDRTRLIHYCKTGSLLPNPDLSEPNRLITESPPPIQSWVCLILAAPDKLEWPGVDVMAIKLFNLSQRKADVPAFAHYFLAQFCQEQNRPLLSLDPSNLRRLISYDYPGNLTELAEILHRAVIMTPAGQTVIPEQVLWSVQSAKNAFRIDLLTHVPWLRRVLLSRWYPEAIWVSDDGGFCAHHDRRLHRTADARQQCDTKLVLGLVVAGISVSLCLCRTIVVRRLSVHDHCRMVAAAVAESVPASATGLEYAVVESLGSLSFVWWVCCYLPVGATLGSATRILGWLGFPTLPIDANHLLIRNPLLIGSVSFW